MAARPSHDCGGGRLRPDGAAMRAHRTLIAAQGQRGWGGRRTKGTNAINGSNEHRPDSPLPARRFDRVARLPDRFNTVVTARSARLAESPSREHLADKSGQTPKPWCSPVRRGTRRETRGQPADRPETQPVRPVISVRIARRNHPPADQPDSQGHRNPEDRQRPDRPGPRRRHARGPRRRLKSLGMSSAPGLHHRLNLPVGSRGSKVLASFSFRLEGRTIAHADSRQSAPVTPLGWKSPHRRRRGMLVYCIRCHRPVNRPATTRLEPLRWGAGRCTRRE